MKRTFALWAFCLTMAPELTYASAKDDMLPETERYDASKSGLDQAPTHALVETLVDDHVKAALAVTHASESIAATADAAAARLETEGRLIYVGAGTSGRLGVLDAVELWPTFGWLSERVDFLMAGGERALIHAVEGAEDDEGAAVKAFEKCCAEEHDVFILLSASGGAPYVNKIAELAGKAGALTIGISSVKDSPLLANVAHPIYVATGAESLQGSTRLKAGTAQKIVLSTLSTAVMMRLGYVFEGLMINVQATNAKLVKRRLRITCELTKLEEKEAQDLLIRAQGDNRIALLMHRKHLSYEDAKVRLDAHFGNVRKALDSLPY
ncbi:MAG: N-acetylmuramic acid 6-phosphate etherase [Candidatus Puniceispirillum sp.]|nr:N-acetylmuramic acid 6-phosphate etherase [Candidatus Puniceispirillum sp.]